MRGTWVKRPRKAHRTFSICAVNQQWFTTPHYFGTFHPWAHCLGEAAMPWGKLPPGCCQHVYPLSTQPWEWLSLIPQPGWLEAGQSKCLGLPIFPWLSYHSVLLLTPVLCYLRGPQITFWPALPKPFLSLSGASWFSQLSAPTGHGTVDTQHRERESKWPQPFHCCVSSCAAVLVLYSLSSAASLHPLHRSPWVRRSWFSIVDLNVIYLHLSARLSTSKTSCSIFHWPDVSGVIALWKHCFASLADELGLWNRTAYHCNNATALSVFDLLVAEDATAERRHMNCVSTLLCWAYNNQAKFTRLLLFYFPSSAC